METTAERVAKNDAAFRQANERIQRAAREFGIEPVPFICECADPACTEVIRLGLDEYERIRADSRLFLNAVGHEVNAHGYARVVAADERDVVVEKVGEAGEIAEELDPQDGADAMSCSDERIRRAGLNEAVFREVNEQLEELEETFRPGREDLDLVCECGDPGCGERLRLPRHVYRRLRSNSRLFAVVPGHEQPDVEDVVEHDDGYDVVRKHDGVQAQLAAETDHRSS